VNPGDTFLLPDAVGTHLYFVLARTITGGLIFCHCTSTKEHTDNTCVIQKGEHEFFIRETSVQYASAFEHSEEGEGLKALEASIIKRFKPLSQELLARICQGALDSPQTADKIQTLLK
jgi:hypothetical protein